MSADDQALVEQLNRLKAELEKYQVPSKLRDEANRLKNKLTDIAVRRVRIFVFTFKVCMLCLCLFMFTSQIFVAVIEFLNFLAVSRNKALSASAFDHRISVP